jgi:hypothetical protein
MGVVGLGHGFVMLPFVIADAAVARATIMATATTTFIAFIKYLQLKLKIYYS